MQRAKKQQNKSKVKANIMENSIKSIIVVA